MRIRQMTILAAIMLGAASPALSQTQAAAETDTGTTGAASSQVQTEKPAADNPDQREILYLSAERRFQILQDMQAFLLAAQDIVIAISENDMQAAQKAAESQRKVDGYDALGMRDNVPEVFYAMAQGTRDDFGSLADVAKSGDSRDVAEELGKAMTNCDVCHGIWQLRDKK